jgi:hypothetical protein
MPGLRIHDENRQGVLAFDLADLLELLGDAARTSTWRCSVYEYISIETARAYLQDAYNTPKVLTGTELLALAGETRQVIDGVFEAFHCGENIPWIKLEAFDSSYWEVVSPDPAELSRFESHFRDVERIAEGDG